MEISRMGRVYVEQQLAEQVKVATPVGGSAKRWFDVVIALPVVLLTLPIMLLTFIALVVTGGPVLSRKIRVGHRGLCFDCLEFRTTRARRGASNAPRSVLAQLQDEDQAQARPQEVSAVGQVLFLSSVYKLPQLFNVLRGEMSLVGPRPISPSDMKRYGERINLYLSARPGLIAPSDLSGPHLAFSELVALDTAYVRNWRLRSDLALLLRAVLSLARPL
jgi:exopolysaccharide production protein ExoY